MMKKAKDDNEKKQFTYNPSIGMESKALA